MVRIYKISLAAVAATIGMLSASGIAHAGFSNVVFAYTSGPYDYFPVYERGLQQLSLNGGATVIDATVTGWYDQTGFHDSTNPNYIAGTCGSSDACNGYDTNYRDFLLSI